MSCKNKPKTSFPRIGFAAGKENTILLASGTPSVPSQTILPFPQTTGLGFYNSGSYNSLNSTFRAPYKGDYQVSLNLLVSEHTGPGEELFLNARILVNGLPYRTANIDYNVVGFTTIALTSTIRLNSNDIVTVDILNSGNQVNVSGDSTNSNFSIHLISPIIKPPSHKCKK